MDVRVWELLFASASGPVGDSLEEWIIGFIDSIMHSIRKSAPFVGFSYFSSGLVICQSSTLLVYSTLLLVFRWFSFIWSKIPDYGQNCWISAKNDT